MSGSRRDGAIVFWRRFFHAFGNGLLMEKLRRHLWRFPPVAALRQWRVRRFHPIVPEKVFFATSSGDCTCNPKAIARELSKRIPDADIVWLMDDAAYRRCGGRPVAGRAVRRWTWAAYREMATAGVAVENSYLFVSPGNPVKRQGQFWMNTWHGSLGIKRLNTGRSARDGRGRANAEKVDAVLTNSDFEESVFAESPLSAAPRIRTGHPRNDIFFLPEDERVAIRRRVLDALRIGPDVKVALFAPTFRDDAFFSGGCAYDFAGWRQALEQRFGGRWAIALRLHPLDARALAEGLISFPADVIDATGYDDMQELLVAADVGITDYSSWIYDYLLGGKPGFIFAPDKEDYDRMHGFYYPLESTPFPVAETNAALCRKIREFDATRFASESRAFLDGKGCMEDGRAAERAVDVVVEWMRGGRHGG